jgi:hypothetical protein
LALPFLKARKGEPDSALAASPAAAWTRSLAEGAADRQRAGSDLAAEQAVRDPHEVAGAEREDVVSGGKAGGEGASTRSPAVSQNTWSATMTASDTAWSESDADWTAGYGGQATESARRSHSRSQQADRQDWVAEDWDEDDDQDRGGYQELVARPEAYRHLWQPPGRKPPRERPPASERRREPGRRPARDDTAAPRQALGQPYVWDGGRAEPEARTSNRPDIWDRGRADPETLTSDRSELASVPARESRPHRHRRPVEADALGVAALSTERAVIGDHLRELAAWCQIGSCIARHTDADALGERDIRNKAVAAGWCVDLFGRLICPSCQQRYPVWCARPLMPRNRPGDLVPSAGRLALTHGRLAPPADRLSQTAPGAENGTHLRSI